MPPRCKFGDFTFDPASGELTRDGRKVRLQRQPSRLLELLLSRPGELITRDDIRAALWGDTHVDFERSLNFCVAKLRAALRDNAAAPRFIETVPTRGYRFVAAIGSAGQTEDVNAPNVPADGRRLSSTFKVSSLAIAAVAVILTAIGVYAVWPSPSLPKIVVVPFHNETGTPEFDRLAKGVSDAAVARLATPDRQASLLVIGNAADVRFSFKPRDMKTTGDALGAQYLLLGQVKKDDRNLRVIAHLIRVSDQTHLWARTYDTPSLDLADQEKVAEAIAAAVADRLSKHPSTQSVSR